MLAIIFPRPLLSLSIFCLWLAITNAESFALILLGIGLAILIPRLTRGFWPSAIRLVHPQRAIRFFALFLMDILVANWTVARLVIASPGKLSPALIEVPLDLRDPFLATLLGSIVSLTPGTVSIDVDQTRWILLVHVLDAPDPQAVVDEIKNRYEKAIKEMFEC